MFYKFLCVVEVVAFEKELLDMYVDLWFDEKFVLFEKCGGVYYLEVVVVLVFFLFNDIGDV